jgi:hypothetical protein
MIFAALVTLALMVSVTCGVLIWQAQEFRRVSQPRTSITGADDFERWVLAETDLDYGDWLEQLATIHPRPHVSGFAPPYSGDFLRYQAAANYQALALATMEERARNNRYQEMLRNTQPLPGDYRYQNSPLLRNLTGGLL